MESTRLSHHIANTYVPPAKQDSAPSVPNYHPCLIVQDSQTDLSKIKDCGCPDNYCVKNAPAWIPRAQH